jgi:HD-GYP domain-containing protein (c-di-GMP phosphodiesterase class II)
MERQAEVGSNVLSFFTTNKNFSTELLFHSMNVARIAGVIGRNMGLNSREIEELNILGLLHDLGKCRTPDKILYKPGKLNPREWEVMKEHPADSQDILLNTRGIYVDEQKLDEYGAVLRGHHEKFNGAGYPDKLKGEDIPYMTRILTMADVFDAISNPRVYRKYRLEDPISIMEKEVGEAFDPYIFNKYAKKALKDYISYL